jgi:metal-responsive CopG/Arc/MetJ family transcriptional regulator
MTTQIAVRLPDDLVAFIDATVQAESAAGRAAIVSRALRHERRRLAAEHDARIYAQHGEDEDLADMITATSGRPLDVD